MLVFLALNGIMLTYTQEELYTIVLQIASGDKSRSDLLTWIKIMRIIISFYTVKPNSVISDRKLKSTAGGRAFAILRAGLR